MRIFHPVNSLVVSRNLWLLLLIKILLFLNLVQDTLKIYKILRISNLCLFFSSFRGCSVISNFYDFSQIKVAKHFWGPCCHLATETGHWITLIAVRYLYLWAKQPFRSCFCPFLSKFINLCIKFVTFYC